MTDALVAFALFVALLLILPTGAAGWAGYFAFLPADILGGALQETPVRAALSPLVSQFLSVGVLGTALNLVFLLIVGRYLEKALGGAGMLALFVAGAYGGALARLLLTPGSLVPTIGCESAILAMIGGYLMLYGLPRAVPVMPGRPRLHQIAAVAAIWTAFQLPFVLLSGAGALSVGLVEPLGGLIAGVALARPLLLWRYRKA
ncbi:rhomboid family intramembrane serine protease [Sphingomonas aracearum]|uniref:rhomboid family intramembrane serine protease n=1 Tax=Sphingomonas aracearum TaxID=2283317 RepID=UPI0015F0F5C3|nr:rhomboid family intramembrane serine protease [Sphingomonas aracearum]